MVIPRQLLLDLGEPTPPSLDSFIVGDNIELCSHLTALRETLPSGQTKERFFYLWGDPGTGRSHLLHALCQSSTYSARWLDPNASLDAFQFDPQLALYAIDNCQALSNEQQIAAFNLFNQIHTHAQCVWIATGHRPPRHLSLRPDLRSRLAWGLVYQLLPLNDTDKINALIQSAEQRGITLAQRVPAYLLTHFKRDMPSLIALFNALDRFALEQHRTITLPLIHSFLNQNPIQNQTLDLK